MAQAGREGDALMDWETFENRAAFRRIKREIRAEKQRQREKWVAWTVACLVSLLAWYIIVVSVWGVMS